MKTLPTHKRCPPKSGCGKWLPANTDNFYHEEMRVDKLSLYCKTCKNERTKAYNRKNPIRRRNLQATLMGLPAPRYDNLIKLMLQIAQGKFDTPEKAAKWLGMTPRVFKLLLLKFRVPIPGGEKDCVHEIRKETCHFCR
jgi:hypothetical protein